MKSKQRGLCRAQPTMVTFTTVKQLKYEGFLKVSEYAQVYVITSHAISLYWLDTGGDNEKLQLEAMKQPATNA